MTTKKQKSTLAENIIAGRKKLGIKNATDFAEHAGVPYPTLRDIEAGVSGGSQGTLEKIADALSVEVWQLQQPNLWAQIGSAPKDSTKHAQTKEQMLAEILVRLSALDEEQLRSASLAINNALLAAGLPPATIKSKSSTGS